MKSSYVFSYSFLKKLSSGARIVRRSHRYTDKALEANKDFSVDFEGIPQPWTIGPPTHPFLHIFEITNNGLKKWTKPHWKRVQAHF